MSKRLILASQSPRRRELLQQVRIPFETKVQDVDESMITDQDPLRKVKQLAKLKAENLSLRPHEVVLAADTIVVWENLIFGKPATKDEAHAMITSMSGTVHHVYTGVMIRSKEQHVIFSERTAVSFWELPAPLIDWYLGTGEPFDKAGGYGIQGIGAMFVKEIRGDYFNVVGLPISRVVQELRKFNIHPE
jgi:septum formation protein